MLMIPRVRQSINERDWFAKIDLNDACFQIPIWDRHWRFLQFVFDGRQYEFQVLLLGISPVLVPLQQKEIQILNYLDDYGVHLAVLLDHVQHLSLRLSTQFLGLVIDSQAGLLSLTKERQLSFRNCLSQFRLGAGVTWRLCLRLLGLMMSSVQAVPLALLHMWLVQRCFMGQGPRSRLDTMVQPFSYS